MTVTVITTIDEWKDYRKQHRSKTIGYVPTMGYLHEGHQSLMERAKKENDLGVISIFVNPLQFGPNEDYETYPRDMERDTALAAKAGIDVIFAPSPEEMYPEKMFTKVIVTGLTDVLCGASRPGHFDGVATVLTKLFHIIQPERVYFGQKDAQQVAVVEQMVKELNFPIEVVRCQTIRENDGLAKSSRNVYLKTEEREEAIVLSKALHDVKTAWESGEKDMRKLKELAAMRVSQSPLARIDYIEILSYPSLQSISYIPGKQYLVALAVFFGKTRLIDNIILEG